jgi:exopolyphosphatase/guanosine-5'-triphosphate,3'-diphosphate pyrophosphatase
LLGRIRHEDVRDRTIRRFAATWHIDLEQAARVERTALALLQQVETAWDLQGAEHARRLGWAARLHEIGLAIAYSGYHKHGAYIAANADMPGFSREDQQLLSLLVLTQRRKLSAESFAFLPGRLGEQALRLAALLRLAVLLNRARGSRPLPVLRAQAETKRLALDFPQGWLAEHPLSQADLEQETSALAEVGIELAAR